MTEGAPLPPCRSCGVPFTEHSGIQTICAEVIGLRAENVQWRNRLARLSIAFDNWRFADEEKGDAWDELMEAIEKAIEPKGQS